MTNAHPERETEWERPPCGRAASEKAILNTLLENITEVVLMTHLDGRIRHVNRPVPESDNGELADSYVFDLIEKEHRQDYREVHQDAIETGDVRTIEVKSSSDRWWRCRIVPTFQDAALAGTVAIFMDMTKHRQVESEAIEHQQCARKMFDSHERLRRSVAYETHEGIAQQIAGALLLVQAFTRQHGEKEKKTDELLDTVVRVLGETITKARQIANRLGPPTLEEFGVVAAITDLVYESDTDSSCEMEFSHNRTIGRLPRRLETAIVRIVQELIENARRHSRSKKIRVELIKEDGHVQIEVQDWGIGFDQAKVEEDCFGLREARTRARVLGGQTTVNTAPSKGTHVIVRLPTREKSRAKQRVRQTVGSDRNG
jgi:PAS domain S-box-containing protein